MKITECMTREVRTASRDQSIQQAAQMMLEEDAGTMPVCDGGRVIGMVTDRDIAVRAVAEGRGPDTRVGDVMTSDVICCQDDQEVSDVAQQMSDRQIRRMPVVGRDDQRLVGIVSLADVTRANQQQAAVALDGISQPGGEHNQSRSEANVM